MVAAASYLGFLPAMEPRIETMVAGIATLLGSLVAAGRRDAYARFVVLDAQGLVAGAAGCSKASREKSRRAESKPKSRPQSRRSSPPRLHATKPPQIQPAKTPADSKTWIDGSRPERESYDDADDDDDDSSGPSKLSKADRKRLRKLKAQNRAA